MATLLTGYAETSITTGKFVRRRASDGAFWNTSGTPGWQAFTAAQIANYGIAATETGASGGNPTGIYTATDPADTIPGDFIFVKAAAASLVVSDLTNGLRWQDPAGPKPAEVLKWSGTDVALVSIDSGNNYYPAVGIRVVYDNAITADAIANGAIDTATFAAGTTIPRVTLTDTVTVYTGNTPQTGDSFARIGATGSALTSLATAAQIAALNNLSAAAVNAEVLDVLNVDTFTEPSGAPPATASLVTKIGRVYQALRNQLAVSATAKTFYSDAGAALWSKTLSDNGTVYTEAEGA